MVPFGRFLLTLKSLINYTVSLIEHLSSHQAGHFDCWLYHACSDPPGNSHLLDEIIHALDGKSVSILSTNSRFNCSKVAGAEWRHPSLLIVHTEYTSNKISVWENYGLIVGTIPRGTKILILLSTNPNALSYFAFIRAFVSAKIYNVAFLSVDEELMLFPDFVQEKIFHYGQFWPPAFMFPDQQRYLNGKPLRFSLVDGILNGCQGTSCYGNDVTLVKEMARYLNTSAEYVKFVCPYQVDLEKESIFDCIQTVAFTNVCPFDILAEPAVPSEYPRVYLEQPIPFDNVFLAPSGRSLNIAELFLRPFQTELWFLFFVGIIVIKLVSILVPNTFKNDPLLLPICGFERYDLNQAGRNEKVVMLSLIVLFFFISNAYETKIISLMSSKPRITLVTTLQDILDSKTPVKADYKLALKFPMFNSVYLYLNSSQTSEQQLDGTSVYLTNGFVGSLLVQRAINWDYESNQPRYKVMEQKLAMGVGFYPVPVRSALKHHLGFVQKALFEAGFLARWRHQWIVLSNARYVATTPEGVNPGADILSFADLVPAWFVVLCGTVISGVGFVAEVVCARWISRKAGMLEEK
ncbi:hypothetical protein pipiens_009157 [Culex pipiens pipiens]|uniref:Ionotropic receptor n=1 Tax=Culex pipiens pipiens TaxID=38569 RepID=A0ABD1DET6_CULPP